MRLASGVKVAAAMAVLAAIGGYARGGEPSCATELASVGSDGSQPNGLSLYSAVSPDGRYVAFSTAATNIVVPDENGTVYDIIVRDLETDQSILASKSTEGEQANGESSVPCLSEDAAYVAFQSDATNLVAGDANDASDIFRHRLSDGTTELVSVNDLGEQGNGASELPSISYDGSRIVFLSEATNLDVSYGATPDNVKQVYLRDLAAGTTILVSKDSNGNAANLDCSFAAISGDGQWVALATLAKLLPARDRNTVSDIYLYGVESGERILVSRRSDTYAANGNSYHPALSYDGSVVAFDSSATNLAGAPFATTRRRVYAFFREDLSIRHVSRSTAGDDANDPADLPSVSGDGRYVCFSTAATNLVPGDTGGLSHVYMHELETAKTALASISNGGERANGDSASIYFALSRDASVLGLRSKASNLVPGAIGTTYRIYVRRSPGDFDPPELTCPDPIVVECTGPDGAEVTFDVSAADACDPDPALEVSVPSGSTFPLGTTTVTATASDAAGNQATCDFTVTVTTPGRFLRGDSNGDLKVNVTDAVHILRYLFAGGSEPPCLEAADANDDGHVTVADPVYLLRFLARMIDSLPDPGTRTPGLDPTPDDLGCGAGTCMF